MPSTAPDAPIGLGLGSNLGDAPRNIARALALLEARGLVRLTAVSRVYRTAPWGHVAQEAFANACALGLTQLAPRDLLVRLKTLEADMGRAAGERWGPRLIDLDILFYGDETVAEPGLSIPHPHLFERAFVLVPLAEIAPGLRIQGRSVAEAAARLGAQGVEIWPQPT